MHPKIDETFNYNHIKVEQPCTHIIVEQPLSTWCLLALAVGLMN